MRGGRRKTDSNNRKPGENLLAGAYIGRVCSATHARTVGYHDDEQGSDFIALKPIRNMQYIVLPKVY